MIYGIYRAEDNVLLKCMHAGAEGDERRVKQACEVIDDPTGFGTYYQLRCGDLPYADYHARHFTPGQELGPAVRWPQRNPYPAVAVVDMGSIEYLGEPLGFAL